jgi:hypothetical protein
MKGDARQQEVSEAMIRKSSIRYRVVLALTMLVVLSGIGVPAASAGTYIVAQCSPGLYPGAPDASFSATTTHYQQHANCAPEAPGLQIVHGLSPGETGTVQGAYGAWVWQAPAGTFITSGSVFSRLATESGHHGYLAVSPDAGSGLAFAVTNDDQGHETGIPAGNWRFLVARLECTVPNEGNRCVGPASGAHTYVKQVRIGLTDVAAPHLQVGGSLLSGGELRGPQTLEVAAADEGSGLQAVGVTVNGKPAAGEDLSAACNPLPGNMTSRMAPCPPSVSKTYTLDTAQPPFHDGINSVSVCVHDYSQAGAPNSACESREVLTDNLCPGSPAGGGQTIKASFVGNHRDHRTLAFHRRAVIRGRLRDGAGNPIASAQVCIQGHTNLEGRAFHLIGTTTTNPNGGFSFKLRHGPSRIIRVGYRFGSFQALDDLTLNMRTRSTLHVSRHRTRPHHPVCFSGGIAGPRSAGRVVLVRGTVPGAPRVFLVRRAKTDAEGHWRACYAFAPSPPARFEFWSVVPSQGDYPYARGHSVVRYVRLLP